MNKKNLLAYGAVAVLFAVIGACSRKEEAPAPAAAPAAAAPAASTDAAPATAAAPAGAGPVQAMFAQQLPDDKGMQQALSQWQGKNLVVNFWAPWCGPCVEEMPELSELQKSELGKNVQVLGIGIDSPTNIAEFAKKFNIAYPVYVAGMSGTELSRQFGNTQGGLPFTVVIGKDGQVKKTYLGRLKFEQLRSDLASM